MYHLKHFTCLYLTMNFFYFIIIFETELKMYMFMSIHKDLNLLNRLKTKHLKKFILKTKMLFLFV